MKKTQYFRTFPITSWGISSIEGHNKIAIKFGYSTTPQCTSATHFESQFFSLSPEMTKKLIHELNQNLSQCDGQFLLIDPQLVNAN